MRRLLASDVVLKALGLLLLTAAVLKGHELLTVPVANVTSLVFQARLRLKGRPCAASPFGLSSTCLAITKMGGIVGPSYVGRLTSGMPVVRMTLSNAIGLSRNWLATVIC